MNSFFNQKRKVFFTLAIALGALVLVSGVPKVLAVSPHTKTWTGAVSTDWATAGNWSSSGAPDGTTDTITIPSVGITRFPVISSTVTGMTANVTVASGATLTIASDASLSTSGTTTVSGTLTIASGASLSTTSTMTVGGTITNSGALDTTGNLTISSGGTLAVPAGTVSLNISKIANNGTFTVAAGAVTVQDLTGTGVTSMSGGTLTIKRNFNPTTPSNFSASAGTVVFDGVASGAGGGDYFGAGTYQFYNVSVLSGDPGFSHHSNTIHITKDLAFTSGVVSFSGTANTANTLHLNGAQKVKGTWGSTASAADNQDDTYFAGSGYVTIASSISKRTRDHFVYSEISLLADAHGSSEDAPVAPAAEVHPVHVEAPATEAAPSAPVAAAQHRAEFKVSLKLGMKGEAVTALQQFLTDLGFLKLPSGMAYGYYGKLTMNAVSAFQEKYGLVKAGAAGSGKFGPKTRSQANLLILSGN